MLVAMLYTEEGAIVIQTKHDSLDNPRLLELLNQKGIRKFVGFTIPVELARERYGQHYFIEAANSYQTDELFVIDSESRRAFNLFSFSEMSAPFLYESPRVREEALV